MAVESSGEIAIEVEGLRKSYGGHEAVRGVSLRVRSGEIFAFLGPNGAGKTTTVEILEGFRRATGETCACSASTPRAAGATGARGSGSSCRRERRSPT